MTRGLRGEPARFVSRVFTTAGPRPANGSPGLANLRRARWCRYRLAEAASWRIYLGFDWSDWDEDGSDG